MAGKNPYPGVNAHLNSALQVQGWQGFHNKYLTSTPYYVVVTDPRIKETRGKVDVYQIRLFDPLPRFYVPLDGDVVFILDVGQAYQQAYDNSRLFQQLGDPSSELKNRQAYSDDDQIRLADFIRRFVQKTIE